MCPGHTAPPSGGGGGGGGVIACSVGGGVVTTHAGSTQGLVNATGTAARFNSPYSSAVDSSGNLFVYEGTNNIIRRITPSGVVTTFAGSGVFGDANGTGTAAQFRSGFSMDFDPTGNLIVADQDNNRIRAITPGAVVTTFAGSTFGYVDATGTSARFGNPIGVAVNSSGTMYVADQSNVRIRSITPAGVVSTLAGNGTVDTVDGTGTAATFGSLSDMAVDAAGNVYVVEKYNDSIRRITPAGVVTTLAGGTAGYADGSGAAAQFNNPTGIDVDSAGTIYVADTSNHRVRTITPQGVVGTLAGSGTIGSLNGTCAASQFNFPLDVSVTASGVVYVVDGSNHLVRKIE